MTKHGTVSQSLSSQRRADAMWRFERDLVGNQAVVYAGVDEVGRGCIAGPVYAGAVVLGGDACDWLGIDDSKKLTKRRREALYELIMNRAVATGIGVATVEEIDEYNILEASRIAMGRAIEALKVQVEMTLVDGISSPLPVRHPYITVVDGDAQSLSIAAASIIAKVERDRFMARLAEEYPGYGFEQNAGYGTPAHLRALREHGPTPYHRRTFSPVKRTEQLELGI
jgi:ribonuclease HII